MHDDEIIRIALPSSDTDDTSENAESTSSDSGLGLVFPSIDDLGITRYRNTQYEVSSTVRGVATTADKHDIVHLLHPWIDSRLDECCRKHVEGQILPVGWTLMERG
jgi:hypothetical protein